jgi:hypothetical protein
MQRQWVAYRVVPGVMLRAPLPSAPEVGDGWRGVELRRAHPLEQFDPMVLEAGARSEAAIGVHVEEGFAYVIATAEGSEPVRLVLGVDTATPADEVAAILQRAGVSGKGARWRARASKAFESWSSRCPRQVDAHAVQALMGPEHPPAEAVSWLAALLGIRVPSEPIPDPLDLQSLARGRPGSDPDPDKRRWFSRRR